MMQPGQIRRNTDSVFGDILKAYALNPKFKIFVEIGTWTGRGSTVCFMDGLLKRFDGVKLYSLETDPNFYSIACNFWNSVAVTLAKRENVDIPTAQSYIDSRLELMHGRIVETEDIFGEEEIQEFENYTKDYTKDYNTWRENDIKCYKTCKNILHNLPDNIDVLLLDGGEFSTYQEFLILRDRTKLIMLDDTQELKCKKVVEELEADDQWSHIDSSESRQGWAIYYKK